MTICKAKLHRPTNSAWNNGCRHAGAIEAHTRWTEARRIRRVQAIAHWKATGECVAASHRTLFAYEELGCRHDEAIAVHRRRDAAKKANLLRRRRVTDGPWKRWRGPQMRVNRVNLWMLVHGMPDSPTRGELIAAIAILSRRGNRVGILSIGEIAARVGLDERQTYRLRRRTKTLAAQRSERRAADAELKSYRVAAAAGRKAAERARHEDAHIAQAWRFEAWKVHCRTMRRLRESQARAKVVALAIQRRGAL